MITRSIFHLILAAAAAMIFICLSADLRPAAAQTCDKVTDEQISQSIYSRINGDKALASQVSHINVGVLYQVVKLQGWTLSQKDFDKVVGIASTTSCVRMINQSTFLSAPPPVDSQMRSAGGCSSGMKACGDICIPDTDVCSITAGAAP
jgi:osmotically-inducible protein OsmY